MVYPVVQVQVPVFFKRQVLMKISPGVENAVLSGTLMSARNAPRFSQIMGVMDSVGSSVSGETGSSVGVGFGIESSIPIKGVASSDAGARRAFQTKTLATRTTITKNAPASLTRKLNPDFLLGSANASVSAGVSDFAGAVGKVAVTGAA